MRASSLFVVSTLVWGVFACGVSNPESRPAEREIASRGAVIPPAPESPELAPAPTDVVDEGWD